MTEPAVLTPSEVGAMLRLTAREAAVLACVAEGVTEREIARRLGVTVWTVRAHRSNARRKLGAATVHQAVAIFVARRTKLLESVPVPIDNVGAQCYIMGMETTKTTTGEIKGSVVYPVQSDGDDAAGTRAGKFRQ